MHRILRRGRNSAPVPEEMTMLKTTMLITAAGLAMASSAAQAQDRGFYVTATGGFVLMGQSNNGGDMTDDYVLGLGAGTLTDQARYRFETDFDLGFFAAGAIGKETVYGPFRSEFELSYTRNNVADHSNLQALGGNVSGLDAAVLTGGSAPVGLTIGRVLEDAQGDISTLSAMINGYYDFDVAAEGVRPYFGVGVGFTRVMVDFSPSGLPFVDDEANTFGYQVMGGVDYDFGARHTLHAGVRYRATLPVEFETGVLPSDLEVDVNQFVTEIGWRVNF